MKNINNIVILSFITVCIFMAGCTTGKWEKVDFVTPGQRNLPGTKPKICIKTNEKQDDKNSFYHLITNKLKTSSKVELTTLSQSDYLLSINNFFSYREDNNKSAEYNTSINKKTKINKNSKGIETGGYDYIEEEKHKSNSAILISNISIYETNTLEPISYFSIETYDSSFVTMSNKIKTREILFNKLQSNLTNKIYDILLTSSKKIDTFIPENSGKIFVDYLLKGNNKMVASYIQKEIGVPSIKNMIRKIKKDDDSTKKEELLSNFYIYLLSKEQKDVSLSNLSFLHTSYVALLAMTENDELIKGCTTSLARLETKSKRLNIKLISN